MRKNKFFIVLFLILAVLIVAEFYVYANYNVFEGKEQQISFVVTGDNLDYWVNLKSGAETASLDKKCQVTFLNSPYSAGVEGEIELINRQLSDGADYVYVASGFYSQLLEYVKDQGLNNKVRFIINGNLEDEKNSIICDDYSMGKDYGEFLKDKGFSGGLYLMYGHETVNNSNFISGLEAELEDSNIFIKKELVDPEDSQLRNHIYNIKQSSLYSGMMLLDKDVLDIAVDVTISTNTNDEVFAVDGNTSSVYYLDSGLIQGLACRDDYSMGYIAVNNVLKTRKHDIETDIPLYYIVEKSQIHSEEFEKVLFPFVK